LTCQGYGIPFCFQDLIIPSHSTTCGILLRELGEHFGGEISHQ
jgi:hypothetical protein